MNRVVVAVAISLLAGFAVGAWFSGDEPAAGQPAASRSNDALPADASAEDRLQRLEQIIAEERDARIALEDTLAMLFDEIERLEGAGDRAVAERRAAAERQNEARTVQRRPDRNSTEWLHNYQERRVARLIEGGFAEDEARRILEQESEASYKAMQAAWEARRNGENLDPFAAGYSQQAILRREIGDDAYTRYLEAQGQPTSVMITQVMNRSPGSDAGLQAGDQIISYDGDRVFNVSDLRNHTMQGDPGQEVVVEILRDGNRMQLTLPRGPIGIAGSGASIRGANRWGS